jgi:methylenetetrahydrofolate dehydrogenase (NADP+)/methenyltetrahydrofolate cyclohydrolase
MELLYGRPAADLVDRAARELLKGIPAPQLAVILSNEDPSSLVYSRSKVKKGTDLGMDVKVMVPDIVAGVEWATDASSEAYNADGVVFERPLPPGTDPIGASSSIPPGKDVEGMHPENQGLLLLGRPRFVPPTALGVLMLLDHYGIGISGKRVAVLGRGANVGRPLSVLLSQKAPWGDATVTLVHSRSPGLEEVLSGSDIVIAAVGSAGLVKRGMVRDDAVLIDVGLSEDPTDGRMKGDVDLSGFEGTHIRATPTPGGTGPVTVSCMFLNVVRAKRLSMGLPFRTGHKLLDGLYGMG